MFVVGLLNEDGIVVDMLEVHDLLVEDLNLAKISQILLYEWLSHGFLISLALSLTIRQ